MRSSHSASLVEQFNTRLPLFLMGYLVFVIYGSLIPFELREYTFAEAVNAFRNIRYLNLGVASRGDWVANILLYIPLAFLLMALYSRSRETKRPQPLVIFLVFGFCGLLAVVIEFTQIFFAPRTVSLNDLFAEIMGSALGIFCWLILGRIMLKWIAAINLGGRRALNALFVAYLVALIGFSLFPFDFLISYSEFAAKIRSGFVAIMWFEQNERSIIHILASRVDVFIAFVPFGMFLSLNWKYTGQGLKRALIAGALVAIFIECLQFFVASGITEGGGVLFGAFGAGFGYWCMQYLRTAGVQPLLKLMALIWLPFLLGYFAVMMLYSGWFSSPWVSITEATSSFESQSLIPFYYHYFSTEVRAVLSMTFSFLMYVPLGLGLLMLALKYPRKSMLFRRMAPLMGGLVAVVLESGKLFVTTNHPDYTNVLIAILAVWMGFVIASWLLNQVALESGSTQGVTVN